MIKDWIVLLLVLLPTFAAVNGVGAAVVADAQLEHVFNGLKNMDEFEHQEEMLLGQHDARARQLLYQCDGPTETYYFEVFIRITPDSNGAGDCTLADQVLLGNEFNQLLLQHGIGEAGVDDDVFYLAGVCPRPTTTTDTTTRKLYRVAINGFVFNGGGGCRYCLPDNYDARKNLRHLSGWFESNFAPKTSATLENAILTEIAPHHTSCLGRNPVIDIEIKQVGLDELDLTCEQDGTVIESLRIVNMGDAPMMRHNCQNCVSLDFSQFDDGAAIDKGTWIGTQFQQEHGLTITATGGHSPSSNARIFDTGDAECVNVDGSRDFGSPNANCGDVTGGLGEGDGGQIGESGENCVPIGNVLIVQESDKECPDSNTEGGIITFTWDSPVLLSDIGLMDVDEEDQRIRIKYSDDFIETFSYKGFGDNAVQRVIATKLSVIQVEVIFPGTGAVTEINFCAECLPLEDHDSDHHCLYTDDETKIQAQEVISFEDFDPWYAYSEARWSNPYTTGYSEYLTTYVAEAGTGGINKFTYLNPSSVDNVGYIVEFDFYEIDKWGRDDTLRIVIIPGSNFQSFITLGDFNMRKDEGHREGTNAFRISWTFDSIDSPGRYGGNSKQLDQRHRMKITFPATLLSDPTGWFAVNFMSLNSGGGAAGYDNVKITAVHKCT